MDQGRKLEGLGASALHTLEATRVCPADGEEQTWESYKGKRSQQAARGNQNQLQMQPLTADCEFPWSLMIRTPNDEAI